MIPVKTGETYFIKVTGEGLSVEVIFGVIHPV